VWSPIGLHLISDNGIRVFINLIFFASLMPEEGRGCTIDTRLFCVLAGRARPSLRRRSNHFRSTMSTRSGSSRQHVLTRTAALFRRPSANGSLWCDGMMNVGGMGYETWPGRPGVIGVRAFARFASRSIRSWPPASPRNHIRKRTRIRAGSIRAYVGYGTPEPVRNLLKTFQARITSEVLHRLGRGRSEV
jgi:hypothetical protein